MSLGMFRTQALKRVSSPEQLDRVVRAALPLQWVALVTLLAVVAAVVIWSIVASVPTTLAANGSYLPAGGLWTVSPVINGTIRNAPTLRVGASVTAGEILGHVTAPAADGAPADVVAVRAPIAGTLVEVNDFSGTYVTAGQNLATVEPTGRPLVVYAYLPAEVASGLIPGVPVQVAFGGGVGATFGYAKGVVTGVTKYPVSDEEVRSTLGDNSLADQITASGPVRQVTIGLLSNPTTPSGLVWGTGQGPPGKLPAGLPASVRFVLGSHHPIDDVV